MTHSPLALVLLLAVGLIIVVGAAWLRRRVRSQTPPPAHANLYRELRNRALGLTRESVAISGSRPVAEPWGVIMETGFPEGTATLVTLADGSASLYLSSGGGTIGGGEHEAVANASRAMVTLSATFLSQMIVVTSFPLPMARITTFFVRTDSGVFSISAPEESLGEGQHALSPLFYAGQEVITQLRLIEEEGAGNA